MKNYEKRSTSNAVFSTLIEGGRHMEKSKRLLTLVAIVAVVTISGVALAINEGWFTFVPNFGDLDEGSRRMVDPFVLTELPEFFTASVTVEGSGYTGQLHTVDISISHARPDSSTWVASGDYTLNLELSTEIEEPITSGSFSGLQLGTPYVASPYAWTPLSPPNSYDIVLSLSNIAWTVLPTYTITATVGSPGGTIVSGPTTVYYGTPEEFTVLQGDPQGFNIIPDLGFEIEDVLVNGSSVGPVSSYLFEDVKADHNIHANFSEVAIFSSDNVALEGIPLNGNNMTLGTTLFNGNLTHVYSFGEVVEYNISLVNIEANETSHYIAWDICYEFLDGSSRIIAVSDNDLTFWPWTSTHNIIGTFTAPDEGVYRLILKITGIW